MVLHLFSGGVALMGDKKNEPEPCWTDSADGVAFVLRGCCINSRKLMTIPPGRKSPLRPSLKKEDPACCPSRTSAAPLPLPRRASEKAHRILSLPATAYGSLHIRSICSATRSGRPICSRICPPPVRGTLKSSFFILARISSNASVPSGAMYVSVVSSFSCPMAF